MKMKQNYKLITTLVFSPLRMGNRYNLVTFWGEACGDRLLG